MVRLIKFYGADKAPFEWKRGTGGTFVYIFRKDRHAAIVKSANGITDDFILDDDDADVAAITPAMTIIDDDVFEAIQHTPLPRDTASAYASASTCEVPAIRTMMASIMSGAGDITNNMDLSQAGNRLAAVIAHQRGASPRA
jgi:hypothetical protein